MRYQGTILSMEFEPENKAGDVPLLIDMSLDWHDDVSPLHHTGVYARVGI